MAAAGSPRYSPRESVGMRSRFLFAISALIAATVGLVRAPAAEPASAFGQDVKPLLARRCFSCHGPNKHEGGLRLDQAEGAVAELDSGLHAIVSGKVDDSALIARVTATDESERMPPEGKPLSAAEIENLKGWI